MTSIAPVLDNILILLVNPLYIHPTHRLIVQVVQEIGTPL